MNIMECSWLRGRLKLVKTSKATPMMMILMKNICWLLVVIKNWPDKARQFWETITISTPLKCQRKDFSQWVASKITKGSQCCQVATQSSRSLASMHLKLNWIRSQRQEKLWEISRRRRWIRQIVSKRRLSPNLCHRIKNWIAVRSPWL